MPVQKTFIVKIYSNDGTTQKGVITTDRVLSGTNMYLKNIPSFMTRINNGQGELILDLVAPFDNFSEGTIVKMMNIVKVYSVVVDSTVSPITQTQTLIYTGFISRYAPYINDRGEEGVKVTCLGLVSLLARSYYGGFGETDRGPEDATVTAKAIIDHFNTIYGGTMISYSSSSIPATVGANITYTFIDIKWLDALVTSGLLAGTNWWWVIREDGLLYFQAKPSSATHRFVIGRDIVAIDALKDAEKVINDVQVRRVSATASNYSDATSQATYGTGGTPSGKISEIISDTSISNVGTADQRGKKEIADKKDAKVTAKISISPRYNIDSIHVGDTCSIFGYASTSSFFSTNMLIASTDYKGDTVDLELEQITTDFGTVLNKFVNPATAG